MARYLYSELASLIDARKRCGMKQDPPRNWEHDGGYHDRVNNEWFERHSDTIERLVSEHMPSGSGFDNGTKIDLDASHADKLVFTTAFHHMHESGMYDGWTEHTVTVTPSLTSQFHLRISGRDRNEIKDYIHQTFDAALSTDLYESDAEYRQFAIERGLIPVQETK